MKWVRCEIWNCPGPWGNKERPWIATYGVRWTAESNFTPICVECLEEFEGKDYVGDKPEVVPMGFPIPKGIKK